MQIVRLLLLATMLLTGFLMMGDAQAQEDWGQCPAGSTAVYGGGGTMCQCPDGSYAGYSGCRTYYQPQPQVRYCDTGGTCGLDQTCCGNRCCHPGTICTKYGCLAEGDRECGNHVCRAGYYCGNRNSCIKIGDNDCGNGTSCPGDNKCSRDNKHCLAKDTVDCESHFCNPGSKCGSGSQCLAADAVDCGGGKSCSSGYVCRKKGGGCATREQLATEKAAEDQRKRDLAAQKKQDAEERKRLIAEKKADAQRQAEEKKAAEEQRRAEEREAARRLAEEQRAASFRAARIISPSNPIATCATAYELIEDMANGRPPRGPQCSVPQGGAYTYQPQEISRQPANNARRMESPYLQLNPNLYTDIAPMPMQPPPSVPLFGTPSQTPAFATLGPHALHTFSRQSEPTASALAHQNAGRISEWLKNNEVHLRATHSARHKRALEYALENDEFKKAVADVIASKIGSNSVIPRHLVSDKQAEIMNMVAHLALDTSEFRKGNYYLGTLHMINTISSATLGILKPPWGGNLADGLNIAGSFVTAYTYGYFWGV